MPFFIKAASRALERFPILNSRPVYDEGDDSVVLGLQEYGTHNIGIAMDTAAGLIVPVCRGVEQRGVVSLATELQGWKERVGRQGSLAPSDLGQAGFSLSNIGSVGGTYMAPIIPPGSVSIAAIGKLDVKPVWREAGAEVGGEDDEGEFVKRHVVQISFSATARLWRASPTT